MPRAAEIDAYGGIDQRKFIEKARPESKSDEVLVRTLAAGKNPGEIAIREEF